MNKWDINNIKIEGVEPTQVYLELLEKERREETNQMAKKAKKEIRQTGSTNIRCPECGTAPVLSKTEHGERTIVACECGYVYDVEINL